MKWGVRDHDYIQKRGNRMTQLIDKPSIDEVMAHVGVKGMKWGHTTGDSSSSGNGGGKPSGSNKKPKVTTSDIHNARIRTRARILKVDAAQMEQALATTTHGRLKAQKVIDQIVRDEIKSGDVKVANKTTRGEKVAITLYAGITGAMLVGMLAAGSR